MCTAHVHSSIALLLGADTFYAAQTSSTKYKRMSAGCAVAGGCIYIAGGHNLDHYLNSIERYDPRTPKWKLVRSHATQHAGGTQQLAAPASDVSGWCSRQQLTPVMCLQTSLGSKLQLCACRQTGHCHQLCWAAHSRDWGGHPTACCLHAPSLSPAPYNRGWPTWSRAPSTTYPDIPLWPHRREAAQGKVPTCRLCAAARP